MTYPAGTTITIHTDNGGAVTGVLVNPLSDVGVANRLGAYTADIAYQANGFVLPARIPCNRIKAVTR